MSKDAFYNMLDNLETAETKGIKVPWDLLLQMLTLLFTWLKTKNTGGTT